MSGGIPPDWPRPLALMVACLDPGGAGRARDLSTAMDADDWDRFLRLTTTQHRVAPQVAPMLRTLDAPDRIHQAISGNVQRNALRALGQISETAKMRAALAEEGIEIAVFKGWPLAERLFGGAAGRHVGDLDLLVPEDRILDACAALGRIGYAPSEDTPKFQRRARALANPRLVRACKDVELVNPDTGVAVELHWQFLNYHGWPRFLDRPGALEVQQTQAGPLLVPDERTNLMYLSTHGALHLWDRLKWLVDIAALARMRDPAALDADIEAAREAGVLRPVAFALSFSARLFDSPLPRAAAAAAEPGLERWILRRLARPEGRLDTLRYQLGIRRMALGLAQGWDQTLGVIGYDTTRRLRLLSLDFTPAPARS